MAGGGDDCAAGVTISPGAAGRAIIAAGFERLQAAGILGIISRWSVYSGECDFVPTSFSSLATRIELAASCKAVKSAAFHGAVEPERYFYIWEWRGGTI